MPPLNGLDLLLILVAAAAIFAALGWHLRDYAITPYACPVCHERFEWIEDLDAHEDAHFAPTRKAVA